MPKPRRQRISLNDVIAQGLSFMGSLFAAAHVAIDTKFDPSLPAINGDEGQLWQVVLNLVRNSLEAMPEGGTLTVVTRRARSGVAVMIGDTGKGMTEEERQQIFKPFFSTKPSGTGLGLPLVQQVVAEHGGTIRCESALGGGTTFVIELPYAEEP
jgi:signal transduction histidine kinase